MCGEMLMMVKEGMPLPGRSERTGKSRATCTSIIIAYFGR
jgi:hypothetical protein